jgi:hypothetical protein
MTTSALRVLIVLGIPIALFISGGYLMMHITGRDQFPRTRVPTSVPLNFRLSGYDSITASAYWEWLGPDGRLAERRFLEADLVFPFLYGGAMLASLLLAWTALGRAFDPTWLVIPVAITVLSDWIENLLHWHQLKHFLQGEPLQAQWIEIASIATSTKLVFFSISMLLILVLSTWLLIHAFAASK